MSSCLLKLGFIKFSADHWSNHDNLPDIISIHMILAILERGDINVCDLIDYYPSNPYITPITFWDVLMYLCFFRPGRLQPP